MTDDALTAQAAALNGYVDIEPKRPTETMCRACWLTYYTPLGACPDCKENPR